MQEKEEITCEKFEIFCSLGEEIIIPGRLLPGAIPSFSRDSNPTGSRPYVAACCGELEPVAACFDELGEPSLRALVSLSLLAIISLS
jgi:hypothetical protein